MRSLLRIAICEDTQAELDLLLTILERSRVPMEYTVFHSGEEFLETYQINTFDLIFMDIYMGGITGVEAVTQIRTIDEQVNIAFTTTSLDFTLESYRLDVLKYIEKPVSAKVVIELLHLVQLKKENVPKLSFSLKGHEQQVPLTDILYLEQKGSYFFVHVVGGEEFRANGKLVSILEQLEEVPFYHCHKSYIVNFAYVKSLDKELLMFEMLEGDNVHIRRDSFWKTKKAYEEYLFTKARRGVHA